MKRDLLYLIGLVLLIAVFGCSNSKSEISGVIIGEEDQNLILERLDVNKTFVIDSIQLGSEGSFSIKIKNEEPELYILRNNEGAIINLLVSPGDRIFIETSHESFGHGYRVEGSEESEGIRTLVEHLHRTRNVLDSLQTVAGSIEDPESPQMDLIRNAYGQAFIKQNRFTIKYLVENMGSLSSVYALYQKYDGENLVLGREQDLQYFKSVADSLEITHPNSSLTLSLRADIEQREARFKEAAQVSTLMEMAGEETGLLDLSIPDREGKEISLSSLKGKVVLLTFWASGHNNSIEAMLQLKSTYNTYHARGFEVYAISLDNNKIQWMSAIDFNEFNWINVSELSYPNSTAALLYNVSSLPATFLINREGDIVAKNLLGRNLNTWLDNLI
ncbi:MAG: AhpC/TSA family protein [Bacteroidia bacterium]|nr:MAG: AhpC/TSA family protein [Bacteroidia bacterium]